VRVKWCTAIGCLVPEIVGTLGKVSGPVIVELTARGRWIRLPYNDRLFRLSKVEIVSKNKDIISLSKP
jgi:hypothetical protein